MNYNDLTKEQLIQLLKKKNRETHYGLVWEREGIEKDKAYNEDFVTLEFIKKSSVKDDSLPGYNNFIIEGDNFDALRYIKMTHSGKIKCIYIDPPYNTGNKDFLYNDRYIDPNDKYKHSTWLEFMYQRLVLAKDLLTKDGVIFVSIDDNEIFQLGMLMNKIFGEKNFVANITWHKKRGKDNSAKFFSISHEYILVFAKDSNSFIVNKLELDEETKKAYRNPDNDPRGPYRLLGLWSRQQGGSEYDYTTKNGKYFPKIPWLVNKESMQKLEEENKIVETEKKLYRKLFLSENSGSIPETIWLNLSNNANAKDELKDIFLDESSLFDTPKPTVLIKRILKISTNHGDTILDFFAGSGTTAHAVLKLNKEDGGNRKFILVSNTEATNEEPNKNLCKDICAERVKKVITGYTNKHHYIFFILGT
ncbi:MAG: site-specific DNA-methyltransferase [Leptospiraceae bacterium]|nr:site-specific DNA-methyltransferase [Leptospiraceae bacterium]